MSVTTRLACRFTFWLIAVTLPVLTFPAAAQSGPQRLSDWLLQRAGVPNAYPLGLSWRVPEEEPRQFVMLEGLLAQLSSATGSANQVSALRLANWLRTLPPTGRVPVPLADARWLQANPARDPIVLPHHRVILPTRPRSVTVIAESGERCAVAHASGAQALSYVHACEREGAGIDWAWIVQPDGQVQRFGAAFWNQETQDEPAPGAWIWAPSRGSRWSEEFSERLARYLATQGPAPDPEGEVRRSDAGRFELLSPKRGSTLTDWTAGDWGGIGLLQTPTARMSAPGHLSFTVSRTTPYTRMNVIAQPFDWMEAGFRYVNVANREYGPGIAQGYKDKSFDLKLRLWKESAYVPELAVGARDIAGTGLFSGEYVVASKRTGDLDWSLGLGWGYVGGRGNLRNPLARLFPRYESRATVSTNIAQTGSFTPAVYFSGPTSLFGGIQYRSPWEQLVFKLEYDGNDYLHEPIANNQAARSAWNFGMVYRVANWADLTVGVERGNTLTVGLSLHNQLNDLYTTKVSDPPRVPLVFERPTQQPDWTATSREIARQTGWHVGRIEQAGGDLRVTIDEPGATYWDDPLERIALVLQRDAPASVDRFVLIYNQYGTRLAEHVIDRNAWLAPKLTLLAPGDRRSSLMVRSPHEVGTGGKRLYLDSRPRFEAGLSLDYRQTLGGPDGFILFQFGAVERMKWRIRDDTWLQGSLWLALQDNYDKFKVTGPSDLPRVRTFLREYLTTSKVQLSNLQFTHFGRLAPNQYYSVYGGLLEEEFAGVGAEWLYRRFGSGTAFGLDMNFVRQRAFEQNFKMLDNNYRTLTGHATLYWDTGWQDVKANVSVGKYLARDLGVTVEVLRTFQNGVTLGAFATRTNVSAAQFGEGSFDKGIFVRVPFDAFLTRTSNINGTFLWRPLTRDGGAKLNRHNSLYDLTAAVDDRLLWYKSAPPPNDTIIASDRRYAWQPAPQGPTPYLRSPPRASAQDWTSREDFSYRLTEALYAQEFRNIRINFDAAYRLNLALSNSEVQPVSRAVGRAARTALRLAPLETREIRITFSDGTEPLVTYEFTDALKLQRYLDGQLTQKEFAETVAVHYIDQGAKQADPLARLNDLQTEVEPKTALSLVTEPPREVNRVIDDFQHAGRRALEVDWTRAGLITAGAVASSSLLDKRAFRFAAEHKENRWMKTGVTLGDWLPWTGLAASALLALDGSDADRARTASAATEAGATALAAATALKYAFGRARPESGAGARSFSPFSSEPSRDSFPSRHTIVAWAVATPYAKEYGAPWLYGAAALTNLARIGSREHWVSDTVGSALLGYGLGELFWQSSRERASSAPRVSLAPSGVNLAWQF